ncbi:MAG: hypothetical protein MUP24_04695, partial [Gillisia sp.]|nr:hypothetical protein [Gillisia sp.]
KSFKVGLPFGLFLSNMVLFILMLIFLFHIEFTPKNAIFIKLSDFILPEKSQLVLLIFFR